MKLADYLHQNDIRLRAFAERIGVTPESVRLYARGRRIPRPAIMARIVAATGGAVGPQDFFDQGTEGEAA